MSRQVDDATFEKRQDAILDYLVNWGDNWLGADTLSTSSWIIPSALTKASESFDDDKATVFISGGVIGQTYELINQITSAGGRLDKRPIYLRIIEDDA